MKSFFLQVPSITESLEVARLEAFARSVQGVISAVYHQDESVLKLILLDEVNDVVIKDHIYHFMLGCYVDNTKNVIKQVKSTAKSHKEHDDIASEFEHHKKGAIFSLIALGAFEIIRRVNPTLYATSTLLRSALVLYLSRDLFVTGLKEAFEQRRPNAETLTVTAISASILANKPESSLSLLAISHFAEGLTTLAAKKARKNITDLVSLETQEVWVTDEHGFDRKVPIEQIKTGMVVSIHDGEKICVDGLVIQGQAAVDQAAITGESTPILKKEGDRVYAGSTIGLGDLKVKVEKVGDETSIARIVHLVEDAQNRRAPIQNYADKIATSLVPVSFIAAGIVYLFTRDLQRVLNMLFIDFSCGLKLSTATAMSAAISRLAKDGVLVKGGSFIEQAASVDTIVLDKTGTITKGRPEIVNITLTDEISASTLLSLAASAEVHSSHPMAMAILKESERRKLEVPPNSYTKNVIARGIEAHIGPFKEFAGGTVLVGSDKFMAERKIALLDQYQDKRISVTGSLIYVAANGKLLGVIESCDPIRADFKRSINRMRNLDIEQIVMLTGDNHNTAEHIANTLGLDSFQAQVMPEDKATLVSSLQRTSSVLMVGDGINDAPALAYADIGVAMGTSCTDTAMETADVTINSEDPLKLPEFIALGKKTMRIVHQNFAATIAINAAAMTLGALGLINPLLASIVHNASTLGVVLNSTRVLQGAKNRYQVAEQKSLTSQTC